MTDKTKLLIGSYSAKDLILVTIHTNQQKSFKRSVRLTGAQIAQLNKLLSNFEDKNWKEYGEAIYN